MVLPIKNTIDSKKSLNAFFMVDSIVTLSSRRDFFVRDYTKMLNLNRELVEYYLSIKPSFCPLKSVKGGGVKAN